MPVYKRSGQPRKNTGLHTPLSGATPRQRAQHWLDALSRALSANDPTAAGHLFLADGFWRDLVAFTWDIRTMEGRDAITAMLRATLAAVQPANWTLDGEPTETNGIVEAWLRFDTATRAFEAKH